MDWRILAVLAALLILLVIMGDNPFELPEGWVPMDPFSYGIKTKLEGQENTSVFGVETADSPRGSATPVPQTGPVATPNAPPPAFGTGANHYGFTPGTPVQPLAPPPAAFQPQPAQPDVEQPKPFQGLPMPATGYQPGPESELKLPSVKEDLYRTAKFLEHTAPLAPAVALENGAPVRFAGPEVYGMDAYGVPRKLPDGIHKLSGGGEIIIRYGKRQLPPNYFAPVMPDDGNG